MTPKEKNAPPAAVIGLDPNKRVTIHLHLPSIPDIINSEDRVLTITVPASALQENQLHQVITDPIITFITPLPPQIASSILQQYVNSQLQNVSLNRISVENLEGAEEEPLNSEDDHNELIGYSPHENDDITDDSSSNIVDLDPMDQSKKTRRSEEIRNDLFWHAPKKTRFNASPPAANPASNDLTWDNIEGEVTAWPTSARESRRKRRRHHNFRTEPSSQTEIMCTICGMIFKEKDRLKQHLSLSHSFNIECPHCPKKFVSEHELTKHIVVHTSEKLMYFCEMCDKGFMRKYALKRHFLVHKDTSEKLMYFCEMCDKGFPRKCSLKRHFLVHNDTNKIFNCTLCPKTFRRFLDVKRHLKVHDKYFCEMCNKGYLFKYPFKRHLLLHDDTAKALNCTFCPKTFRTHKKQKKQVCQECGGMYADRNYLNKHMEREHGLSLPDY